MALHSVSLDASSERQPSFDVVSVTSFAELSPSSVPSPSPTWKVKLLYDGECPLCMQEVNFLRSRDAGRGIIAFVDIADPAYDPADNGGVDFETAMGRIHAVLADGTVVQKVEVFRQIYTALGMGWLYAITKLPLIGAIADALYDLWAAWRLRLTGRPDLATIVAERHRQSTPACDLSGRCR